MLTNLKEHSLVYQNVLNFLQKLTKHLSLSSTLVNSFQKTLPSWQGFFCRKTPIKSPIINLSDFFILVFNQKVFLFPTTNHGKLTFDSIFFRNNIIGLCYTLAINRNGPVCDVFTRLP